MSSKEYKEKISSIGQKIQFKYVLIAAIISLIVIVPVLGEQALTQSDEFSLDANATAVNATSTNQTDLGVVTDPTLNFGEIPANAAVQKSINIGSEGKTLAHLDSTGNISEKLEYNNKELFEEQTEIETRFNSTEPGYYNGTVELTAQTPQRTGGELWLEIRKRLPY